MSGPCAVSKVVDLVWRVRLGALSVIPSKPGFPSSLGLLVLIECYTPATRFTFCFLHFIQYTTVFFPTLVHVLNPWTTSQGPGEGLNAFRFDCGKGL